MNKNQLQKYQSQARIMKTLAHHTRLFIVNELSKRALYVNEITEMVGVDISTISRHLSLLKNAGIVADEKKGKSIYYSLRTPCVLKFFNCLQELQRANSKIQREML